jgi:hypothetical protein
MKRQSPAVDLLILAALLGATNLGTALTFGTMAFLLAVLALMLLPSDE